MKDIISTTFFYDLRIWSKAGLKVDNTINNTYLRTFRVLLYLIHTNQWTFSYKDILVF